MGSIVSYISGHPLQKTQIQKQQKTEHPTLEDEAQLELEKWCIDIYSKNTYLHKIPEHRKQQKLEEIRGRMNARVN
jgi:hypothetical protein